MAPDANSLHPPINHDNDPDEDEDDSDASSVTTVGSDNIPAHFDTRHGRLFHSHGTNPYPLPVDTPEMQVC